MPSETSQITSGNTEETSIDIETTYWNGTTEGSTFDSKNVQQWLHRQLPDSGTILNPCAGTTEINTDADTIRVDIDPEANADMHIDFRELPQYLEEESVSAIVYDPPYTPYQARNKYGLNITDEEFYFYSKSVKKLFHRLLEQNGVFIQFGYTTSTMPAEYGYIPQSVGLFNKLGAQNDYLAIATKKSTEDSINNQELHTCNDAYPNEHLTDIGDSDASQSGNEGKPIKLSYHRTSEKPYRTIETVINNKISTNDQCLHIYNNSPSIKVENAITCQYDSANMSSRPPQRESDITETPWNIGKRFDTSTFDYVVLDLPRSAFRNRLETPDEQRSRGSDYTNVATAIKRSIHDIVRDNGGSVIQIGHTATTMSKQDFNYRRSTVDIINSHHQSHDYIVTVDTKLEKSITEININDGEIDSLHQGIGKPPTDKQYRPPFDPDNNSFYCPHCGNKYFHHPAAYVHCDKCGAAPNNCCSDSNGKPVRPSGENHRITKNDVHRVRVERSKEWHSGECNCKERTFLDPDEKTVQKITQYIKKTHPLSDLSEDADWIRPLKRKIKQELEYHPKSRELSEAIIARLRNPNKKQKNTETRKETSLSDF